ncbi:MAG TPA: oxygenase MpaB family protein, partial [Candidatus Acidoferrum sp.]|nr:oxygenase MpaB family protein [Candidatus Acidoferrum sp.]
ADTALVTYETFVQLLSPSEREEFHEEFKLLAELLGIPRDRFPATVAGFDSYLKEMVSTGPVRVDARARELAAQVMRPRARLLPGPVMLPLNVVTTGLLPPALREQYNLPWGPRQQRAYRVAIAVVPRVIALTPPVLRVWPRPGRSIVFTAGGRATTTS